PLLGPWLPPVPTVLVPLGAQWRYHDLGALPAANWHLPAYDDTAWPAGPAQLGYGDGDEATVVASGPAGAVNPTLWFRHAFDLVDAAIPPTARVRVLCDDGCVVYVNGVEVGRWNLHNGFVSAFSPASIAVSGTAENAFHVFAFDPKLLTGGRNVVAVEVHQVGPTSSDASFDCELLGGAGPISVLRGPYLQNGTPTAACVRWRTDQPTSTRLWLGPSAAALQPAFFDATLRTEHAAVAGGLQPETTYCYAIGDATGVFAGVPAATLRTLPPPGATRPLRAWVLGDAGFGWLPQYAVRELYSLFAAGQRADAILMLGDNAYWGGTDREYQVGLFDVYGELLRDTFTWSTLGNHDAYSAATATGTGPYYDIFTLPRSGEAGGLPSGTEAYYSFDRGHVHFVCLDSMDSDRSAAGAMMTWLQADLANTAARWIVAFFHHPPYSAGSHRSDDPLDSGGRLFDMRQIALPILEAGGVDLVLSGHSHSYERSFLLDGHYGTSATLQPAMVRDRGDGRVAGDGFYGKPTAGRAPHEGAVYVVAGSAGSVSGGSLDHPAMHVSLNNLGSFVFDVDGDRLDAKFVGLSGIEDEFTLVKGDPRTLFRDQVAISVANGGRQDFRLAAGQAHAGSIYVLAGAQGTSPGMPLFGVHVPLNPDPWLTLSLALANSAVYPHSIGLLDANGAAAAALVLPPLNDPALVGTSLWHAYVVSNGTGLAHASNAVRMTFAP
ncbi:MAG: metallophosphoesterase family protein, partial [Planctomycetota bacterium]